MDKQDRAELIVHSQKRIDALIALGLLDQQNTVGMAEFMTDLIINSDGVPLLERKATKEELQEIVTYLRGALDGFSSVLEQVERRLQEISNG